MADKKMTRAEALENAITLVERTATEDDACNWTEVASVLRKMHASVTRPRKKSDAPTKAQRENVALAAKVFEAMTAKGEPVDGKWIAEHVNGIPSPQKCTAVMRVLIDDGKVVKTKEGKRVTYSLAE